MDFLGFAMDHMGPFSPYDIPNLLFALLVAGTLGYFLARVGAGLTGANARALALWAGAAALAAGMVRGQLPMAVALLALVLLAKGRDGSNQERVLLFSALVLGMGCGGGATLVMLAVSLPYILVVRWAFGVRRS